MPPYSTTETARQEFPFSVGHGWRVHLKMLKYAPCSLLSSNDRTDVLSSAAIARAHWLSKGPHWQ